MRFYQSTFTVAFILIALAVGCAFIPEIKEYLRRFRRIRSERHVIRREDEPGPRPARPDLKREEAPQPPAPPANQPPAP
ncbi:MAG TPA: hypothetical protein VN231_05300 [Allosphingosinicella sp.]|nr:hypothetical protein [Allosphingosinicella sp.]